MGVGRTAAGLAFGAAMALAVSLPANAGVVTYTSSSAFATAVSGLTAENYGTGAAGQLIASGGSFDGLTYSFTAGPSGTLQGGIITNQFNSFTGLSLGGDQSVGAQFFFGGDSVTISFAAPVDAVGAFFNVNPNSGNYLVETVNGDASTGSASYDTSTFVFAGLTSTTPFTSVTLRSDNSELGSFNVPEIEYHAADVPEPMTLSLFGAGLAGFAASRRRRKPTV